MSDEAAGAARSSDGPSRLSEGKYGLVTKVARMYHEEGIRQPEIAERLGMSQSRVSRFLKEAVALGIVRTVVIPPPGVYTELEVEIRNRFGMKDVLIADAMGDGLAIQSALGAAGAAYLDTTLTGRERIGISSWSSTLVSTVDSMVPKTVQSAETVVQAIGGVGDPRAQIQATHLADRLARVTGASPRFVAAPGIVSSPALRTALLEDEYISAAVRSWKNLSVLLAGIGSVQPSALLKDSGNSLSGEDLERLRSHNAVGDVCLRFFDEDGVLVDSPINDRIVGIDVDDIRRIPRRVGIAGGSAKHTAIRGAIKGGWVNVLVTDLETARFLVAD